MNVLRDTAILDLQRNNVEVLEEQLRQTRDRFNVGEVTRTDVAQAESRLARRNRARMSAVAESNLQTSIATYRQVVGVEPRQLAPGRPLDRLVPAQPRRPRSRSGWTSIQPSSRPSMPMDVAELQVKIVEGELAPTLGLNGSITRFL